MCHQMSAPCSWCFSQALKECFTIISGHTFDLLKCREKEFQVTPIFDAILGFQTCFAQTVLHRSLTSV